MHLEDGVVVDAKLSPPTRDFLRKLALDNSAGAGVARSLEGTSSPPSTESLESQSLGVAGAAKAVNVRQVEVPLVFDAEFFGILQTDVSNIGTLQKEEQVKLEGQIIALAEDLGKAVEPSRGRRAKADLDTWRQIFDLYLDARVFFSSRESDHGARTSTQAVDQLRWFQDQVVQRKLVQKLKLGPSQTAFANFVNINATLLSILKFQEINRLAVTKILKSTLEFPSAYRPEHLLTMPLPMIEFDKRTSLGVSTAFPATVRSGRSLTDSVAQDVCARSE